MNLVLLEDREVLDAGSVRLTGPRAEHIAEVLKAAPGDQLRVGVIDGATGTATVTSLSAGCVELRCTFNGDIPPRPPVDLLLAVPRPKVMRRLWAQLGALGVGQIILTNAARVERNYFDTHVLTEPYYRPLLIEGLQQARDTRVPAVSIYRRFKVLVEDELDTLFPEGVRVAAHPESGRSLTDAVRDHSGARVLLAVGPEGGWTTFELDVLAAHGFQAAGAGARTLRSDTACIALVALAHEALRG